MPQKRVFTAYCIIEVYSNYYRKHLAEIYDYTATGAFIAG